MTDLEFLARGELEVLGRIVEASNATLLCTITDGDRTEHCAYKPVKGERPLWDFPDGTLAGREVASFAVSEATGWNLIPPTILRDGPHGPGMAQLWIDGDEDADLLELVTSESPVLRRFAVLDAVINNSDRKGGHLIPVAGDGPLVQRHVYGVDHGVTFSVEDKLRTVLWHWAGKPLTDEAIDVLHHLRESLDGSLGATLAEHLTAAEVRRTRERVDALLQTGRHPEPTGDWPAIPYPPF